MLPNKSQDARDSKSCKGAQTCFLWLWLADINLMMILFKNTSTLLEALAGKHAISVLDLYISWRLFSFLNIFFLEVSVWSFDYTDIIRNVFKIVYAVKGQHLWCLGRDR